MDIQAIKNHLKANKITYDLLSEKSGIPLNTLKNIFSGRTPNPRMDTIQAIERALGLEQSPEQELYTDEEKKLLALISELTDEETQELSKFVDFIISKRQ